MQIAVYKTSGGKDIVLHGKYSPEARAKILVILKKIQNAGFEGVISRLVNKNSSPKLYEIKHGKVRIFYFTYEGDIYITHIVEHKQKNKTEAHDKSLATERIKLMVEEPNRHVAWI